MVAIGMPNFIPFIAIRLPNRKRRPEKVVSQPDRSLQPASLTNIEEKANIFPSHRKYFAVIFLEKWKYLSTRIGNLLPS
jgi:hypothetical protein